MPRWIKRDSEWVCVRGLLTEVVWSLAYVTLTKLIGAERDQKEVHALPVEKCQCVLAKAGLLLVPLVLCIRVAGYSLRRATALHPARACLVGDGRRARVIVV